MDAKVMTANQLRDGDVVYLTAAGDWSLWLGEAEMVQEEDGEARLESNARQAEIDRKVVSAYLMDVRKGSTGPEPIGTREKIRAKGPTVHPFFGKQAMMGAGGLEGTK